MKNKKLSVLLVICIVVTSFTLGVSAEQIITKVAATIDKDLKLTFDGEKVTPEDVNGNEVPILVYEGSSYLPVRSVASLAGVEVGWDGSTKTIELVKDPVNLDKPTILDLHKAELVKLNEYDGLPVNKNNRKQSLTKDQNLLKDGNGNSYEVGILIDNAEATHDEILDFNLDKNNEKESANFPSTTIILNGNYKKMKGAFKIKAIGGTLSSDYYDTDIKIYDIDNELTLATYNFREEKIGQLEESNFIPFECDVIGVDKLAIFSSDNWDWHSVQVIIGGLEFEK